MAKIRSTTELIYDSRNGYKFGNVNETISSALGKNQRDKTLSWFGKIICLILDTIDENHCKKSIQW